jgi:DNA-binding transcriptional MerR regulator
MVCIFASSVYVYVNVSLTMPARTRVRVATEAPPRTHTITELAAEFDITARAIRFYEDVGLLTPSRAGRNRVYTQRDRTRLKLTLRGKRLGLSLLEIKQLVDMYDSPSDTTQQLTAFMAVLASTGAAGAAARGHRDHAGRDRPARGALPQPAGAGQGTAARPVRPAGRAG